MRLLCLNAVFILFTYVSCDPCMRNGVRCLDYEVIQSHEDYEERRYPSLVWVSASGNAKSKSDVSRKLIKKLYAYLGGENDRGERLDMVVPVRTTKLPQGTFNRYTMAVALKPEQSENPPHPTDPQVTVSREPATTYVSRSFGGQVRQESIWDDHMSSLQQSTASDDNIDDTYYYMSVYDSPWTESDRLNEVWMKKKQN